jgi:hypothetical protein
LYVHDIYDNDNYYSYSKINNKIDDTLLYDVNDNIIKKKFLNEYYTLTKNNAEINYYEKIITFY